VSHSLKGPNDVICGRGKKCYAYIGNVRFRKRVAQRLQQYTAAKVGSKIILHRNDCDFCLIDTWIMLQSLAHGLVIVRTNDLTDMHHIEQTKDEKSHVVMLVVNEVRRESPYGGFVKKNSSGVWYEVVSELLCSWASLTLSISVSGRLSRTRKDQPGIS